MERPPDPDRTNVLRAQAGDQDAMAGLLQRYRDPVFSFVHRLLVGHANAEDVAHETFVRAFQNLHRFRFRRDARFSTWLFQLARHAALDEARRLRRRPETSMEERTSDTASPQAHAADQLAHRELGDAIARAVATLPEDQRAALLLAEYQGHSAEEVAHVLKCSRRGAESRLFRARQTVRGILTRQGWV